MGKSALPARAADFILEHIHSVEQLEVLLLLRARPFEWSARRVAAELRIAETSAQNRLNDLHARGFLQNGAQPGAFRYEPESSDTVRAIDDVAECWARFRVSVINLIFSVPRDVVRVTADSSKLRKKEE